MVKRPLANSGDARDICSIPGSGRFPRGRHSSPLIFLPGESHAQKAWQARVHRVIKRWTGLK